MKLQHRCRIAFVISMLVAAVALPNLITVKRSDAALHSIDLATIPTQIGSWRMTRQEVQASNFEKSFLNDVLYRIYERPDGKSIALAIAYGADQRQNFSIHVPEGCYRASGYDVTSVGHTRMSSPDLTMKQMLATKDRSTVTVQYWIVLNGKVVTSHFERKLKQLYYSLLGAQAGGVLVRVSSFPRGIDSNSEYVVQREFVTDLYKSLKADQRINLFGA